MATSSHTKIACVRTSAWSLRRATVGHYVANHTRPEISSLVKRYAGLFNPLSHSQGEPRSVRGRWMDRFDVQMDGWLQ